MNELGELEKKEQRSLKAEFVEELDFTRNSDNSKIRQAKQMYLQKYVWRRINLELWEEMQEKEKAKYAKKESSPAKALLEMEFKK